MINLNQIKMYFILVKYKGVVGTKQIIEKHNGKIWADKKIKTGAKFVFMLPIN